MNDIPKILHQIWVGPRGTPSAWMNTWPQKNPDWEYRVWGNKELKNFPWHNKNEIKFYALRGLWNGVADLMRYEILFNFGGIITAADSICLRSINELFEDNFSLYSINTGEAVGRPRIEKNIGSCTPLYACTKKHPFALALIEGLHNCELTTSPVWSTGNRYMQRMIKLHNPEIKIWPMHFFIPDHFDGWKYSGPDEPFARHFWGTTRLTYHKGL